MASIFTYDPDPPRVSSPWLTPVDLSGQSTPSSKSHPKSRMSTPVLGARTLSTNSISGTPPPALLSDYNVTKLEPEPQTGPAEYKLHLLLRPRRTYSSSSTGIHVAGSQQLKQPQSQSANTANPPSSSAVPATSNQTRQNRLQQLTTQLLWRLQQSSPYHSSATSDLVLPKLPEAIPSAVSRPGKLLAGLEESRGALYEIGVSDDGTLVGLTEDEMEESLTNLRAMAASLGCNVDVTRMVVVGCCEWNESELLSNGPSGSQSPILRPALTGTVVENPGLRHRADLWVAEAHVIPDLSSVRNGQPENDSSLDISKGLDDCALSEPLPISQSPTEQLRITLTGPTTSGKSSLLGTLSTATLDNGRGKSRLSLLKHRHELASGITSSVAQELLGYEPSADSTGSVKIINYAAGNVTSWTDIHASSEHGRVVFLSDSAGHPRYRRTTVRGLVGWAPHWTMLCIAADDGENAPNGAGGTSSAQDILGVAGAGIDLAKAHLELCLKLEKPMVVIITKLDLASRASLRQTLSKILSAIKATGRTPVILPPDQTKSILDSDLETIPRTDAGIVDKVISTMVKSDLNKVIPIIMTSAAKGTGIRMLHALLHSLPIPTTPTAHDYVGGALNPEQPACLFHVEDTFALPASYSLQTSSTVTQVVVAGYLRWGSVAVGDSVVAGPFPTDVDSSVSMSDLTGSDKYESPGYTNEGGEYGSLSQSLSHASSSELARIASRNIIPVSNTTGEWHNAQIVSIRNLRLPVHKLEAGHVGTIGIIFEPPEEELSNGPFEKRTPQPPRVRKGMVLAIPSRHMIQTGLSLQAASGFTASFEDGDINSVTVGSLVVVYIASIRASARVIRLGPHVEVDEQSGIGNGEEVFGLDDPLTGDADLEGPIFGSDGVTDVMLELMTNREWIELGSQVLIMPGRGQGLYDGFTGKVIEVVD